MVLVIVDTQPSVPSLISEVKYYSSVIAAACERPQTVLYGVLERFYINEVQTCLYRPLFLTVAKKMIGDGKK